MQLFWMEMRKIFSWKIVALIVFVNVLLYWLVFEFNITYFPNGRPAGDTFAIEQQLIPKYGAEIDEKEYKEIVAMYEQEKKKADTFLEHDPKAVALGITTYEAFSDPENEQQSEYFYAITFHSEEDFPWVLQAWEHLIESYQHHEISLQAEMERTSGAHQQRFKQLLNDRKHTIYSNIVLDNFQRIAQSLSIIILFSISILLSPIYLRDKVTSIIPLQYTSKKGRRLFWIKWLAGFVSAVFITIVLMIIYLTMYATNNTSSHFDLPLSSICWDYYWYDMTFFQYIILSIVAIFITAVFLGILSMAISTFARNTIALIGIQIIVMFGMIAGVTNYMISDIISIWHPKWLTPIGYIFLIGLTIILTFYAWRRESRKDIV
ncbi:ABC transporter permease [Lysinibacillus sp. NPDC056185]|uniref:ABC transporter permease n=1 Tax=Lysinibacillus sp. NPDC056185 TaxID=3345739 RepID=UPI0039EFE80C